MAPHYMLLCCSARDGMGDMGMTHLAAALALEVCIVGVGVGVEWVGGT